MRKFTVFAIGLVLIVGLIVLFLQPRKAEETIPIDPLEERASKGDIDALRTLRKKYVAAGQNNLADYWLFKGALMGDAVLVEEYSFSFNKLSREKKQAEIQSIKTSTAATDQKDLLLKKLSIE